jgi:hypothetical protein
MLRRLDGKIINYVFFFAWLTQNCTCNFKRIFHRLDIFQTIDGYSRERKFSLKKEEQ